VIRRGRHRTARHRDRPGALRASPPRSPLPGICASSPAIESRMHAVPVELDLVQPFRTVWSRVDELGQLWEDPLG
jgi:hypothetical protein